MILKRLAILSLCQLVLLAIPGFTPMKKSNVFQKENTLTYGGKNIKVDMVDCSTDNSSDGKSRAIAAINASSNSMLTIQFGTADPASGAYTTISEEPIGPNQVIVGGGGSSFGDGIVATAGQTIAVTKSGSNYAASFKDIAVIDPVSKKTSTAKISGSFGCN